MASIALIGPDGAGKTTVARMLEERSDLPLKYLYMGVAAESTNVALPTTRLGAAIKRRIGEPRRRRALWVRSIRAGLRHTNLLVDEWYRQLVSWWYQLRGNVVIYDRYFPFDYSRHLEVAGADRRSYRMHRYVLERFYPLPTRIVFLDAPPEVLFARKGERTLECLEARRQAILRHGRELSNFVRIDATLPLSEIAREVELEVERMIGELPSMVRQGRS